jgi:hypothetical protein
MASRSAGAQFIGGTGDEVPLRVERGLEPPRQAVANVRVKVEALRVLALRSTRERTRQTSVSDADMQNIRSGALRQPIS